MQELSFVCLTINNVSPINKSHLFLSYAKQDKELMLKEATYLRDLLDCAVFYLDYDEFPNPDVEEFRSLADKVDIFVPIITDNYLNDSFELKALFQHVKDKGVAVMPLVEESGIENRFNAKCGNIQFLQDNGVTNNYTSLEDKIKNFYNRVTKKEKLFSDDAFSSCFANKIFISYRRMDRPKARHLIDKVLDDEELYDVGLWYDEFLSIGKEYDIEINDKIKESTIMLMYITHRVFGEYNYVKDEEYPTARDTNKVIIIPVYEEEYDKAAFKRDFPSLMEPIHLDHALDEIKKHLLPVQRSEEHDIDVALAYLASDGVIRSIDRAERILLKHENHPLAMETLANIYSGRFGYKQDFDKAIIYFERLVNYQRKMQPGLLIVPALSRYVEALYSKALKSDNPAPLYEKIEDILSEAFTANQKEYCEFTDATMTLSLFGVLVNKQTQNKAFNKVLTAFYEAFLDVYQDTVDQKIVIMTFNTLIDLYSNVGDIDKQKALLERFDKFISTLSEVEAYDLASLVNFRAFYSFFLAAQELDAENKYVSRWKSIIDGVINKAETEDTTFIKTHFVASKIKDLEKRVATGEDKQIIEKEAKELDEVIRSKNIADGENLVYIYFGITSLIISNDFDIDLTFYANRLLELLDGLSNSDKDDALTAVYAICHHYVKHKKYQIAGPFEHKVYELSKNLQGLSDNIDKIMESARSESFYVRYLIMDNRIDEALSYIEKKYDDDLSYKDFIMVSDLKMEIEARTLDARNMYTNSGNYLRLAASKFEIDPAQTVLDLSAMALSCYERVNRFDQAVALFDIFEAAFPRLKGADYFHLYQMFSSVIYRSNLIRSSNDDFASFAAFKAMFHSYFVLKVLEDVGQLDDTFVGNANWFCELGLQIKGGANKEDFIMFSLAFYNLVKKKCPHLLDEEGFELYKAVSSQYSEKGE